jgi:hypothetical protein
MQPDSVCNLHKWDTYSSKSKLNLNQTTKYIYWNRSNFIRFWSFTFLRVGSSSEDLAALSLSELTVQTHGNQMVDLDVYTERSPNVTTQAVCPVAIVKVTSLEASK